MSSHNLPKNFILTAPIPKVLYKLSGYSIIAMTLFGLNAFMDTVYIGRLMSSEALSGVALAYPTTMITLGLGTWIGGGAGNLLSIALGKNNPQLPQKLLVNTTISSVLIAMLFAVISYPFAPNLISFIGGSGKVLQYGTDYLQATLWCAPLWVLSLSLNFLVRGEGKMKEAAIIMVLGLSVNLILTPVLITYTRMGVLGAAWATNIGMLVYTITGFLYYKVDKASFSIKNISFKINKELTVKILKSGFPGFIISITSFVQAFVVLNAITKYGGIRDIAFFTASNRVLMLLLTPLFGLMRALQPLVGINYGAHNFDRVKQGFWWFCAAGFVIVMPFFMYIMLFPEQVLSFIIPDETITSDYILWFRVYVSVLPVLPIVFMSLTYFPAVNNPKPASILGILRQLVLYIPLMLLLPKWYGLAGVYYGITSIDIFITILFIVLLRTSFKNITNEK